VGTYPLSFTKAELAQTQHRICTLSTLLQLYQHLQHLRYSLSFCFIFLPSKTCSLERHVRYLDALSHCRLNAAVVNLAVFFPLLVLPSPTAIVQSPLRFHLSSVRLSDAQIPDFTSGPSQLAQNCPKLSKIVLGSESITSIGQCVTRAVDFLPYKNPNAQPTLVCTVLPS
jgi:hypothetical protein